MADVKIPGLLATDVNLPFAHVLKEKDDVFGDRPQSLALLDMRQNQQSAYWIALWFPNFVHLRHV